MTTGSGVDGLTVWAAYKKLDPEHQWMVRRLVVEYRPQSSHLRTSISSGSLAARFDDLDNLLSSALEPADGAVMADGFDLGDPAPEHVPAEWLAELDSWRAEDRAPFTISWDDPA